MDYSEHARRQLILAQANEITEALIYDRIAARTRDANNRQVLQRIAEEERRHYAT